VLNQELTDPFGPNTAQFCHLASMNAIVGISQRPHRRWIMFDQVVLIVVAAAVLMFFGR
jgi:hypothetical protein